MTKSLNNIFCILVILVFCIMHALHADIFDTLTYTGKTIKYTTVGFGTFFGFRACKNIVESIELAATPFWSKFSVTYILKVPVNMLLSPFKLCSAVKNGLIALNLLIFALVLHKLGF